jgi:hypothetical protein
VAVERIWRHPLQAREISWRIFQPSRRTNPAPMDWSQHSRSTQTSTYSHSSEKPQVLLGLALRETTRSDDTNQSLDGRWNPSSMIHGFSRNQRSEAAWS